MSTLIPSLSINLINEVKLWIDAWKEPRIELKQSEHWKIDKINNKGYGMIATIDIKAYTTILIEKPILFESKHNLKSENDKIKSTAQLLLNDFNQLPLNKQQIVMNLANVFNNEEKENVIEGIYDTSACQTNSSMFHTSGLFPTFARINHSCFPNCTMYFKSFPTECLIVKTLFDIKRNDEILLSYLPRLKNTFQERQTLLLKRYKFKCNCSLCCHGTKYDRQIKEYRLAIMNDKHWNCIQTALDILTTYWKSFPTIKANVLSSAINCATDNYMYDNAYDFIVESIELNIKLYGLQCRRWRELHAQIQLLKTYSNDERCQQLLETYKCLWNTIEKQ
eukprot:102841_1